jgi:hypothetical protein
MAAFELRIFEILSKINLEETFGILKNNLDSKWLKIYRIRDVTENFKFLYWLGLKFHFSHQGTCVITVC